MSSAFKQFRYEVGGILIDLLDFIIPHIPIPVLYFGLDLFFFIVYPIFLIAPRGGRLVHNNMNIAFGATLTKKEKRSIARRVVRNLMNVPVISVYYAHPKNQPKMLRDVGFVGLEHLDDVRAAGRGVIGLGAHIGNFILMDIAIAQTDLPFVAITKEPRQKPLKTRYQRWKNLCRLSWIDADSTMSAGKAILKSLKSGMIVHIVADERKKRDGIVVPFFGRPALTAPGPAALSIRAGAPIVPIFITERERYRHTIEILPPIRHEPTGDLEKDTYALTEKSNEVIAEYIVRYPDQWAWTNPRWKM